MRFEGASSILLADLEAIPPSTCTWRFLPAENAAVDEFHRVAMEAGYRDNGGPGERPIYHPGYYGAFVLDPDGNNVEVVNHNRD